MKKKIIYFTKHTSAGPSSRYRSFQYKNYFENEGYTIKYYPLFPASYLKSLYEKGKKPMLTFFYSYIKRFFQVLFLKRCDILFIEYELFPFTPFFIEELLLKNKKNIILDYDDAVFHNYDKSPSRIIRKLCANKIYRLVKLASHVITGSPYLTEVLGKHAKKITEISTSISFTRYQQGIKNQQQKNNPGAAFRIGWIGSKTTSVNLLPLKQCFLELQEKYNTELALIGFDKFLVTELQGLHYQLIPWQEDTEIQQLLTFDAGIMPLTDDAFNNGKCGFKLIQYMACGLPTISTPLDANIKINRNKKNLHAVTIQDWKTAITAIINNRQYYKEEVGKENIEIVKQYYCAEASYIKYLEIFKSVCS